jgi:hypothetical protein
MLNETPMPDLEESGRFGGLKKLFSGVKSWKDEKLKSLRGWNEFFDRSKFSVPTRGEALSRISHNLSYFYSNYFVVAIIVAIYYLITNIMFMISIIVCGTSWYLYRNRKAPVYIGNTEITPIQGYTGLTFGTLIMFYLTSGSNTVFWLITVAAMTVVGHAWAREPGVNTGGSPEDIFGANHAQEVFGVL